MTVDHSEYTVLARDEVASEASAHMAGDWVQVLGHLLWVQGPGTNGRKRNYLVVDARSVRCLEKRPPRLNS